MNRQRLTRWGGALALAVAVVLGMRAADAEEEEERRAASAPRVLDVRYDAAARPAGARRAYPALVVRVQDRDGQVVAISASVDGRGLGMADGGCDLGGARNGEPRTWTLPARLRPGRHSVRLELESSPCDGGDDPLERAVEERPVEVARPR